MAMKLTLTFSQQQSLAFHLRTAAEMYLKNAREAVAIATEASTANQLARADSVRGLAAQFDRQAGEALAMADKLESADENAEVQL